MYDFPVTWLLNWFVSSICLQQRDPSLIRHGSHFLMVCFAFGFRHLSLTNLFLTIRSRRLRHLLYAMTGGSSNKLFKFLSSCKMLQCFLRILLIGGNVLL